MPIKVAPGEHKYPPPTPVHVPLAEKKAYTVREFCAIHSIGVGSYYKLPPNKRPKVIYVGTKPLITDAAAEAWRRELEAEAAQSAT